MGKYFFLIISVFFVGFESKKLPQANQTVLDYVNSVMGTQVGTGECSDLLFNAKYHLQKENSTSRTKTKKILPGDFISFRNVVIATPQGGQLLFTDHQAIVYEVITQEELVIAHQNHNNVRIVQTLKINLSKRIQGDVDVVHP